MVTTKQKLTVYTQKIMRKESKHNTTSKPQRKRAREEGRNREENK